MLDFSSLTHYDWLDVPMWVFDPERQRNLWANAAALSFWRTESAEEFLSRDFSDSGEAVRERLAVTAADHTQGKIVREQWTLYPKGQPTTVMLVSRGIRTPDRRQVMLFAADSLASGSDKSMLRGVEALQHTSVRIAVFSLRDGSALMRNPAASLTFGKLAAQPGRREFDLIFADPADAARVFAEVQAGQSCRVDLELQTLAGVRWHAVDARPMRDPVTGDQVMQLNARDIGDLKASQAALEAAREAAEAASQAKSSFLANMSHEIRTPMNGVLGLTELVLQTELTERQRQFIELAHQSAKGLMVIINDLLDVAKIEAGKMVIEQQPFSLHEALREALQPLLLQAHEKGIQLHARVQPGVPQRAARRRAAPAPGAGQSGRQCPEVHREGRSAGRGADGRAGRERGDRPAPALRRARHWHRHDARPDRPDLRPLHPGRRQHHAPLRRHRPGPDHRAAPGQSDGRRRCRSRASPAQAPASASRSP